MNITLERTPEDSYRVVCTTCATELDRIFQTRTAYLRAGMYAHSCTRLCPVCSANAPDLLYRIPFSTGDEQDVSICRVCGMGYASRTTETNYDSQSIYAAPHGAGSGETERDRGRFCGTVDILAQHIPDRTISILDIGCAQGGLLAELTRRGYDNAMGMDPSQQCVDACLAKNLTAVRGRLDDPPAGRFDLVILSHVLEHVWDVPQALASAKARLKDRGVLYIEVPNASAYVDYLVCPFLDFNREHINHFSRHCLAESCRHAGLDVLWEGERTIELPSGRYPALYVLCMSWEPKLTVVPDTELAGRLTEFVRASENIMASIDARLQSVLTDREIILWGYGEFAQHLLRTEAVQSAILVQIIDRDPDKQTLTYGPMKIQSPEEIRSNVPILIASILNADSIQADIRSLGLTNPVILP